MPLTKYSQKALEWVAVTGLAVIVYTVIFCAALGINIFFCGAKKVAVSGFVGDIENIPISNPSVQNNKGLSVHQALLFVRRQQPSLSEFGVLNPFQKMKGECRLRLSWDNNSSCVLQAGNKCVRESGNTVPLVFDDFDNKFHADFFGGRFASYEHPQWNRYVRLPLSIVSYGYFDLSEMHPSALILPHLSLNSFCAILSGLNLLSGQVQLPFNTLASLNRIYGGLGIQYSGLGFHFSELTIKNYGSNDSDGHEKSSKNHHPSLRIVAPLGLLLVGVFFDVSAMWLIGMRSWDCESRRGTFYCIFGGIALAGTSVFFIWHGLDLSLALVARL
jgi:hypothetical protein